MTDMLTNEQIEEMDLLHELALQERREHVHTSIKLAFGHHDWELADLLWKAWPTISRSLKAAQSPPVAALPEFSDEALHTLAYEGCDYDGFDDTRRKIVGLLKKVIGPYRAVASGLGAQVEGLKDSLHMVTLARNSWKQTSDVFKRDCLAAEQRADSLASENQRLKESFDLLLHDKVTTIERAEAAEASAQAERERVREVERDAKAYARWIYENPVSVRDHACAQCVPHSDMLIAGFVCTQHRAFAAALPPSGEG